MLNKALITKLDKNYQKIKNGTALPVLSSVQVMCYICKLREEHSCKQTYCPLLQHSPFKEVRTIEEELPEF